MFRHGYSNTKKKAFTLTELCAVVCIVLVLAALLFPIVNQMVLQATAAKFTSNLRNVSAVVLSLAPDNNGRILFYIESPGNPNIPNDPGDGSTLWQILVANAMGESWDENNPGLIRASVMRDPSDNSTTQGSNGLTSRYTIGINGENYSDPPPPSIDGVTGWKLSSIPQPSRTMLLGPAIQASAPVSTAWGMGAHCGVFSLDYPGFTQGHLELFLRYPASAAEGGLASYFAFCDGHVERKTKVFIQQELQNAQQTGSFFFSPHGTVP